MKKHALSPRDLEALSAYLDGELSPGESAHLERRLKSRADLQRSLDDLRKTRAVLRSQVRMQAPRNFTLTPQMTGIKLPSSRSYILSRGLSWSSALASVLLVLVLAGEFLVGGLLAHEPPMAPQPAMQVALEQAPPPAGESAGIAEEAEVAVEEITRAQKEETTRAFDSSQAEAGAAAPGEEPAGMGVGAEMPTSTSAPLAEAKMPQATQAVGDMGGLPTAEPSLTAMTSAAELAENLATGAVEAAPTDEILAQEAYPLPEPVEKAAPVQSPVPATREGKPLLGKWSLWRIAQVLLLILAIGSGLGALILRKYSRK